MLPFLAQIQLPQSIFRNGSPRGQGPLGKRQSFRPGPGWESPLQRGHTLLPQASKVVRRKVQLLHIRKSLRGFHLPERGKVY